MVEIGQSDVLVGNCLKSQDLGFRGVVVYQGEGLQSGEVNAGCDWNEWFLGSVIGLNHA